ncbi:uncharacterized protein LOC133886519 [Phragmites australis]|uniref:uncharacterized protein LOC133886519 n=1 Tax=Phragmites australis TaxID=29695 RepID=UPI002D784720|nr:uncharacterized protein LOC133886519 [Phragmites australis]
MVFGDRADNEPLDFSPSEQLQPRPRPTPCAAVPWSRNSERRCPGLPKKEKKKVPCGSRTAATATALLHDLALLQAAPSCWLSAALHSCAKGRQRHLPLPADPRHRTRRPWFEVQAAGGRRGRAGGGGGDHFAMGQVGDGAPAVPIDGDGPPIAAAAQGG